MKTKKIIAFVLVFVLVVTSLIVTAVANAKTTEIEISVDKTELLANETATVSVKVTTDYPVATMSIPVFYDKTLVDVSEATATLTGYEVANTTTDSQSVDAAKVFDNTDVDSNKFGFMLATYIGAANADVSESINEVVLTFKVTAKADASGDAVVKVVEESAKTDENAEGMLYFGSTTNGTKIDSVPENVENIDLSNAEATATITTGGTTIVAKNEKTGVVDTENNYIYGIPAGSTAESFTEYFTVVNGTFEMVANSAGYTNGTGATLVVKNTAGTEVANYTLIIFGDVNGDAAVTTVDANIVANKSLGGTIDGAANNLAADANGDAAVTTVDANIIANKSLGGDITVNPYQ